MPLNSHDNDSQLAEHQLPEDGNGDHVPHNEEPPADESSEGSDWQQPGVTSGSDDGSEHPPLSTDLVYRAREGDDWRQELAGLPQWVRRYLVAREASETDEEAVRRSRISIAIMRREMDRSPAFAQLRLQAIDRALALGAEDAMSMAREASPGIIAGNVALFNNEDPKTGEQMQTPIFDKDGKEVGYRDKVLPRDRIGAGKVVLEASRVIGSRADGKGAVTVNLGVSVIQRIEAERQSNESPRVTAVEAVAIEQDDEA